MAGCTKKYNGQSGLEVLIFLFAKGLYIYSIHAGNFHDVKKLVVQ
jgi:hypothetical protein